MQNFFFATETDEAAVWEMAFAIPGLRVFESSTREARELREYTTSAEVMAAQEGSASSWNICLFPSTVGASKDIEVKFDSNGNFMLRRMGGWIPATFVRYDPVNGCLSYCNIAAWNGPSPSESYQFPEIDWKLRASLFRKLKRQVEKFAPAKCGSIPILPDAFAKLKAGEIKLWGGTGEEISIDSTNIVIKSA